jgi:hypothetical protein
MHSDPAIESLRPYLATDYAGWDLSLPDVQRAAAFKSELKNYEQKGNLSQLHPRLPTE